ncbi:hypothetical protein CRUP_031395 [Coryphaenoides rupestris]|nr:hypothetical protein CRUP_031395 [Coryphaenoides rupestris]
MAACLQFSTCGTCVTSQIGFNCSWCTRLQRGRTLGAFFAANLTKAKSHSVTNATTPVSVSSTERHGAFRKPAPPPLLGPPRQPTPPPPPAAGCPRSTSQAPTSHPAEAEIDSSGEGQKPLQTRLLAAIILPMVIIATAILLSVYVYNHPTSTASLFLLEVSL